MIHSKSRRNRYIYYLRRHGLPDQLDNLDTSDLPTDHSRLTIRFMPLPNATRWNSWFKMAFYVYEYLDYIRGFYKEEKEKETSEIIDNIVSIFSDNNTNGLIELYLAFIYSHAPKFISDTDFFQKECDPFFPFVEGRIQQLETYIFNGTISSDFGSIVNSTFDKFNSQSSVFESIFQAAYKAAYKKFLDHIPNHPSRSLFKATQIFDPRYLKLSSINRDIHKYSNEISQLSKPSIDLLHEWALYCNLNLAEIEYSNLQIFWEKMMPTLPLLSNIAFDYIWLPISSCSVERSFSVYNNILADNRHNLSLESLKMLNMMYFNNNNK